MFQHSWKRISVDWFNGDFFFSSLIKRDREKGDGSVGNNLKEIDEEEQSKWTNPPFKGKKREDGMKTRLLCRLSRKEKKSLLLSPSGYDPPTGNGFSTDSLLIYLVPLLSFSFFCSLSLFCHLFLSFFVFFIVFYFYFSYI